MDYPSLSQWVKSLRQSDVHICQYMCQYVSINCHSIAPDSVLPTDWREGTVRANAVLNENSIKIQHFSNKKMCLKFSSPWAQLFFWTSVWKNLWVVPFLSFRNIRGMRFLSVNTQCKSNDLLHRVFAINIFQMFILYFANLYRHQINWDRFLWNHT